jgi:hypothetical protein
MASSPTTDNVPQKRNFYLQMNTFINLSNFAQDVRILSDNDDSVALPDQRSPAQPIDFVSPPHAFAAATCIPPADIFDHSSLYVHHLRTVLSISRITSYAKVNMSFITVCAVTNII